MSSGFSIAELLADPDMVSAAGQDFVTEVETYRRKPDEQLARVALCQAVRRSFALETREIDE